MAETQEQREARWAEGKARQEAYRASPEAREARLARIASGLCVIEEKDDASTFPDWCVTHEVKGDFDHYLATRPKEHNGHNPNTGIAYND